MKTCLTCAHSSPEKFADECIGCRGGKHWKANYTSNADRIRAMSDEELAGFLCGIAYGRNTPWSDSFARRFCDNCPTVEGTVVETGVTMEFNECDFDDGECPHGSDTVWWLQQPAEEGK